MPEPPTSKIRVLIVDDEHPARERLKQLLASVDDLEVIGEAEDGQEALEKIQDLKPDLVFLDIQMPVSTGLEVAASLPSPRAEDHFLHRLRSICDRRL